MSSLASSLAYPALQFVHRLARQRLSDAAVHAAFGERLAERLQRLGRRIDLIAVFAGHCSLQTRLALVELGAFVGVEQLTVLCKRSVERQQVAAGFDLGLG